MTLQARPTIDSDVPALHDLFSYTVAQGGTTAHEDDWDLATFKAYYIDDPVFVTTVLDGDKPIGFQAVFDHGEGLSIGSFTDRRKPVRGAGAAMFALTRRAAQDAGYKWIDAKIRADNVPGLAYYAKMGFNDHSVDPGVPLKDGTPVDRITKRFVL